MKKLTVEYLGYKLEIQINRPESPATASYIKGWCDELDSFEKSGYYESCLPILTEFMKCIDYKTNYR